MCTHLEILEQHRTISQLTLLHNILSNKINYTYLKNQINFSILSHAFRDAPFFYLISRDSRTIIKRICSTTNVLTKLTFLMI